MDKIVYQGITYRRTGKDWSDMQGFIVHESLQKELNAIYVETIDLFSLSVVEAIEHGDKFKSSSSYALALRFYEYAADRASERDLAVILPRMTACYRKQGHPQKVIDLLEYASKKFGRKMISSALLTSAAAAYCDLREYEKAKKCCNRAFAASGGKGSGELSLVYKRIRKECGPD